MTEQRIDAQSAHRRCYDRIAELEAAIRAVVDASRVEPMPSPWWTAVLDLAIKQAEKVLRG